LDHLLLTLSPLKGIKGINRREKSKYMEYRLAVPEDLPVLAELRWENRQVKESGLELKPVSKAEFIQVCQRFLLEAFSSGRWYIWVAAEGNELVSHIYVQMIEKVPRPSSFQPCFGYITNVYTQPNWRGKGVGANLMESVIAWAKEEGFEMLVLWPSQESIDFYQRAGFNNQTEVMELHLREYQA
jgi:GNAT superfamily N-acetyltransferase